MLTDAIVDSVQGVEPPEPPRADALWERMRAVVIPELDLSDATLNETVDFLRSGPAREAINLIIVGGGIDPGDGAGAPPSISSIQEPRRA